MTKEPNFSLFRRFYIYQRERFPFLQNSLFLGAFAFSAISYSRICRGEEGYIEVSSFLVAWVTTVMYFFLLRILDEFKDRESDALHRPYLPVPRGLITFRELRGIAVGVVVVQVLLNLIFFRSMLVLFVVPGVFLFLMTVEFFVPRWLRNRPLVYMLSHMFFFPAIDIYTSGMDWYLEAGVKAPVGLIFFFAVSYMNGIVYELGRKIRAKENEEHHTYSRHLGPKKATMLWLGSLLLACGLGMAAAWYAGYGITGIVILSLFLLSTCLPGVIFLRKQTVRNSKWLELTSGSWGLFMYLLLGGFPMIISILF